MACVVRVVLEVNQYFVTAGHVFHNFYLSGVSTTEGGDNSCEHRSWNLTERAYSRD